jgi:hypothetical protein
VSNIRGFVATGSLKISENSSSAIYFLYKVSAR